MTHAFQIGQEVVRSKGDYVVGRVGNVVAVDTDKKRVQVDWLGYQKSWVSFSALEPTSIPYRIIPMDSERPGKPMWPKYKRIG